MILRPVRAPIDTVRRAYAAWKSGDRDAFFELLHPDVVFDLSRFPEGSVHEGHAAMWEGWRTWRGTWERYEVEIEELREVGERVFAPTRIMAISKGHGVETEAKGVDVWTVRNGLVVHLAIYMDRAELPSA